MQRLQCTKRGAGLVKTPGAAGTSQPLSLPATKQLEKSDLLGLKAITAAWHPGRQQGQQVPCWHAGGGRGQKGWEWGHGAVFGRGHLRGLGGMGLVLGNTLCRSLATFFHI